MKKISYFLLITLPLLTLAVTGLAQTQNLTLWYDKPAKVWTEALPLGNGRFGAMVFGNVAHGLIQLNEATLWSGGPVKENVNPNAAGYLPQVRQALFQGKYQQAEQLDKNMQGVYSESFEPLGDLMIDQQFTGDTTVSHYYRDLDIHRAVATVRYTVHGVHYTREMFISAPDQVMVIKITADQPRQLHLKIASKSPLHYRPVLISGTDYSLEGVAPAHTDPNYVRGNKEPVQYGDSTHCKGMRFALDISASFTDGTVKADTSGLEIKNASEVVLLVSAATSFNGFNRCPDHEGKNEKKLAQQYLDQAKTYSFDNLLRRHLEDYRHFFDRVSISLGNQDETAAKLPTDRRLERYATDASDPGLEALYFQYGRYLLIASSRTPGAPANLQGIWNKELRPPWSSNYTININTEMNYWPAEECNLSEMTAPLIDLIRELSVTGTKTARNFYHANGWVAHHNTDLWALSNPVGDFGKGSPVWANWPMGGNWLCWHLWQHYLYTGDQVFLKDTAYPLMKGAAEFCLDWLLKDSSGYWVTAPSMSPENQFIYAPGKSAGVSIASTMDMSIIRGLFTDLIDASSVLGIDPSFRDTLIARRKKLYPFHIGKRGNLQEWYKDWLSTDIHHRHISHLYGLFPGNEISPLRTPELAAGVKRALEIRGDESTGWSLAWKINCWARLLDGNHAHQLVRDLLKLTKQDDFNYHNGGGCYPNLFDAHPPFQIDGNFGGTSGIAQMLVQSSGDAIYLLPALPDAWPAGDIKGLKAIGGFEIKALTWENGKITRLVIRSSVGGNCRIRANQPLQADGNFRLSPAKGKNPNVFYKTEAIDKPVIASGATLDTLVIPQYYTYDFPTQAGGEYVVIGK